MQSKISAFFKPSSPSPPLEDSIEDTPVFNTTQEPEILITYSRRTTPNTDLSSFDEKGDTNSCLVDAAAAKPRVSNSGKVLNKKRSYAQFYLELGQSDFQFHNCSICGLKYAPGEEADEDVHKEFHKNYTHGMPFKGWRNERVVPANLSAGSRIVLVLDTDPIARKNKIHEVAKAMEGDLGLSEGWLLHERCKVYLFISSRRIAGCLVAEPISFGYRVISSSAGSKRFNSPKPKATKMNGSIRTVLQFGNVNFQREVVKRVMTVNRKELVDDQTGAIFCEEEAVPAICGIRAIWVSPANRRKHVATKLLDAARTSFCTGYVLEHSQLAFSQPTSAGKALASSYCETESFLVYNTGLIN